MLFPPVSTSPWLWLRQLHHEDGSETYNLLTLCIPVTDPPGIHAGIGQQGMERTVAREAAQITQFGSEPQPPQGQDLEEIAGLSFARGSHFLEPYRSRGES